MKKLLFIFLLAGTITASFAQTINYGIKAGLNLSQLSRSNASSYGSSLLTGFNAGVIVDIGFQNFSIQPGIFYSTKGEKDATEFAGAGSTNGNIQYLPSKTVLGYIEVPVNFLYKTKVAPGLILNLGGGPYIAYGVSQSLSIQYTAAGQNLGGSGSFEYKNPDWGINFVAGVQVKKFIVDAGYGLGINNLLDQFPMHNRVISLSVGYMFR